jgi:arginase
VAWPFENGTPDLGMGAGPAALFQDERLHDALAAAGWTPTIERVPAADRMLGEAGRVFDLLRAHEHAVRGARARGAFPLVLSGGCISAVATVAGCGAQAAVWLDAHADLDTPDDNLSGSLDVMALSLLTGAAWPALRATIPGVVAMREEHVALLGVRDLADYQRARLERSAVRVAAGAFTADGAARAIGPLPPLRYLHIDLDVLDTALGRANRFAAPGGPSLDSVLAAIDATFASGTVLAAALTAYEPTTDPRGTIRTAAITIADHIAHHALTQRPHC